MKSLKSASKKINTTKKGKEATLQTEMQQTASPKEDKKLAKPAQKIADQKKKESAPGIPNKNKTKQAGSNSNVKPDSASAKSKNHSSKKQSHKH